MRRVLYDVDVVLDTLLKRQPHYAASAAALDPVGQGAVTGYLAGHAITTLFYLLRKQIGTDPARACLAGLLSRMRIAAVTDSVVRTALSSTFKDFEDAVTHAAALEAGVDLIVTRNIQDYAHASLPVLLPDVLFTP